MLKKHVNVKVAGRERAGHHAQVRRAAGRRLVSLDQIRQHLNYEHEGPHPAGRPLDHGPDRLPVPAGAAAHGRDRERDQRRSLALVDDEEEYDDLIELEDESDD